MKRGSSQERLEINEISAGRSIAPSPPPQIVGEYHEGNKDLKETGSGVEPVTSHVRRYLKYGFIAIVPVRRRGCPYVIILLTMEHRSPQLRTCDNSKTHPKKNRRWWCLRGIRRAIARRKFFEWMPLELRPTQLVIFRVPHRAPPRDSLTWT